MKLLHFSKLSTRMKKWFARAFVITIITVLLALPLGFWGDIYPQLTLVKGTYAVIGQTAEWEALSTNEKQKRIINAKGGRIEIKSGLIEYIKRYQK